MPETIESLSGAIAEREKPSSSSRSGKNRRVKIAWTKDDSAKLEPDDAPVQNILLEQLKFCCDNSSLTGYKYITERKRTRFERLLWIAFHLLMVYTLGAIVWTVLQDYKNSPVVTVVDSDHYPSQLLDLPGVSVCSINRMSRRAAMKLAEKIAKSKITDLPTSRIFVLLRQLGNLYMSTFNHKPDEKNQLDQILRLYFADQEDVITELMKELTPQCNEVISKCNFRYETKNCSELFSFRKTQNGFCCTFNYARERDDLHRPLPIEGLPKHEQYKIEKLGVINGLTFLLEPLLDDYFFPFLPLNGWKIMIFNSGDYPDNTSGGVSEALISPGTENYLTLDAVSFYSEPSVRRFDVHDRKCIFADEISALYDGYTYSDCIVECKVDDVWRTCNCHPFFYPQRDSRRVCNTSDVKCLQKYNSKWWSVLPHDMKQGDDEAKTFNFISNESWSLRCKNCYPSCDDVHYYLTTSSVKLEKTSSQISFLRDVNIVNQSLVHIFFSKYGTVRLKQDIAYYWYELLSNIGGICGIFIGFSLISAVEFIYFFLVSSVHILSRKTRKRRGATAAAAAGDGIDEIVTDSRSPYDGVQRVGVVAAATAAPYGTTTITTTAAPATARHRW
ncbi:hypothetical protein TKK_0011147 [Trichogramma kaykai]